MDYKIRRLDETTESEQLELFNLVFDETYTLEMWHHKHFENPDSNKCDIFGAFDDNHLVGINGFITSQYQYNNKIYYILQSCESAVHPEYRGKGIFSKIIKCAIEKSELKEDNCYIIGFPNTANAYPGFIKMGWETITWMREYTFLTDFLRLKAQASFPTILVRNSKEYTYFEDCADSIVESMYKNKIRICLEGNRIGWRTYYNKQRLFKLCGLKDDMGCIIGYFIIKTGKSGKVLKSTVVDWFIKEDSTDRRKEIALLLLSQIRKKYGCISVWISEDDPDFLVFSQSGLWEHKKARQPFIGKALSYLGNEINDKHIWMPRMIDYDGNMFG